MRIFIDHLNRIIGWVIFRLEGRHENSFLTDKGSLCFNLQNTDPQSRFSLQESGLCGNHEIIDEIFTDNP
jgi:hypothetical protein